GMLMRDMGERMARHAAGLVAERFHDPPALARRLEQLHAELDVAVAVRDLDGGVIAAAGEVLPRPSAPTLAAVRGGQALVRGRPPADEIAELTRAFNDMAERVERLVRGEKELLANVSHELRSPLARLRMALALLPRDGAGEARLAEAERDLGELERLIDDVLT